MIDWSIVVGEYQLVLWEAFIAPKHGGSYIIPNICKKRKKKSANSEGETCKCTSVNLMKGGITIKENIKFHLFWNPSHTFLNP